MHDPSDADRWVGKNWDDFDSYTRRGEDLYDYVSADLLSEKEYGVFVEMFPASAWLETWLEPNLVFGDPAWNEVVTTALRLQTEWQSNRKAKEAGFNVFQWVTWCGLWLPTSWSKVGSVQDLRGELQWVMERPDFAREMWSLWFHDPHKWLTKQEQSLVSARKVLIGTSELLAVKSKGSYDVSGEPQWQPEWRAVVMAKINVYLEQLCFRPHYLPILPSPSLAEFEYDIPFDNSETWRLRDQGRFNQAAGADSQSGARPQEESFGADDGWPDEDAARRHELQEEEEAQDATDEDLGKIDHK